MLYAIKYNNPKGEVTLNLKVHEASAVLRVTNTGPGIAPNPCLLFFEPFYRTDQAHSPTIEGCGLGLSIVQVDRFRARGEY